MMAPMSHHTTGQPQPRPWVAQKVFMAIFLVLLSKKEYNTPQRNRPIVTRSC
jgi:hypothetical protein